MVEQKREEEQTWLTAEGVSVREQKDSLQGRVGETFAGRYRLESLLGEGSMGSVYRAFDLALEEVVALKMLHGAMLREPQVVARFKREVKLARRITHRNVARTFDLGESGGQFFLTMEFVEGSSLASLLSQTERQGLPLSRFFALALQICAGLDAAHTADVIHRDLKPENILLDRDERVFLSDFGIARQLEREGDLLKTADNAMLGTPAYMAPEQIDKKAQIDHRADIYALGAIFFEMLTGHRPWFGDNFLSIAMARFMNPPPDPLERKPSLPKPLAALVMRCMAREVEGRPPRTQQIIEVLQQLQSGLTPSPLPPSPDTTVVSAFAITQAFTASTKQETPQTPPSSFSSLSSPTSSFSSLSPPPRSTPSPPPPTAPPLWEEESPSLPDPLLASASSAQPLHQITRSVDSSLNPSTPPSADLSAYSSRFDAALSSPLHNAVMLSQSRPSPTPSLPPTQDASVNTLWRQAFYQPTQERVLAILPLRYQGSKEEEYLSEGLVEDLIDSLSMHQELRVRPYSMVLPWKEKSTQMPLGDFARHLGVDAVVEGSATVQNGEIALRLRLISPQDGVQLWAHRAQIKTAELFSAVETLSNAIISALKLRNEQAHHERQRMQDPQAIAFYLRARHLLRRFWSLDLTQVIALFEQARTYAPQEPLILSGYAVALARQAYFHVDSDPTLLQKARLFATQAHQMAPERAEALFALAMASFVAEHQGDALLYLEKALRIDPNYADALDLLGRIEGEFLDPNAARQHLQMACFLDPSIDGARFDLMRICALLNRWQEVDALILQAAPEEPHTRAIYQISRARLNLWRPDPQPLMLEQLQGASPLVLQGIKILDHVRQTRSFTDEQLALYFRERIEPQVGKRFRCILLQQLAEALSYCGRFDRVVEIIQIAFDNGLRDLNWLRFCPLFAPLRSTQPFQSLLHQVTQRVQSYLAPTNEAPLLHR